MQSAYASDAKVIKYSDKYVYFSTDLQNGQCFHCIVYNDSC